LTIDILIGIDLGATCVRVGAFHPAGQLLAVRQTDILALEGPQAGLERITTQVEALLAEVRPALPSSRLIGIGVGSTGPTDPFRGFLLNPLTMPGWVNVPIVDHLQDNFSVPACLENDADAAALGEYWQGAALVDDPMQSRVSRLYAVTAGTGIGTAFIVDGQIYRGADGFHPEGGHMIIDPSGPHCYCGANGCWESLSSGTAIARSAQLAISQSIDSPPHSSATLVNLADGNIQRIDARMVAAASRLGDPLALKVIQRAAEAFAMGIFNILMLFYPEMIVLSGGVMRSIDLFMPDIQRVLKSADAYIPSGRVQILPARLGYYAGIYGAAYAILNRTKQSS